MEFFRINKNENIFWFSLVFIKVPGLPQKRYVLHGRFNFSGILELGRMKVPW